MAAHLGSEGRRHGNPCCNRILQWDPPTRCAAGRHGCVVRDRSWARGCCQAQRPALPAAHPAARLVCCELYVLRHLAHGGRPPRQRLLKQRHPRRRRDPILLCSLYAGGAHRPPLDHCWLLSTGGHLPHPQRLHDWHRQPPPGVFSQVRCGGCVCSHHPLRRRAFPHGGQKRVHWSIFPSRPCGRHGDPCHHPDSPRDARPAAGVLHPRRPQHCGRHCSPFSARDPWDCASRHHPGCAGAVLRQCQRARSREPPPAIQRARQVVLLQRAVQPWQQVPADEPRALRQRHRDCAVEPVRDVPAPLPHAPPSKASGLDDSRQAQLVQKHGTPGLRVEEILCPVE
mmetsp:Transcript_31916/g.90652  ORF Transcript_31916/g.90652 Transcript_31916/m.90652 type:complete len:341 (-) Transcript_31916:180-1202(-)